MADITAACFSGTLPRVAITAGTETHRKPHFIRAQQTMEMRLSSFVLRLRPKRPARMALPQAITGTSCIRAGPTPRRKARAEENRPMQMPERAPVRAAKTKSTQLTRLPVMSWVTDRGPITTAPAGKSFPASWARTTRAMPMAVSAMKRIALC